MQIVLAKYIFLCDDEFSILQDYAIAFDKKILQIAPAAKILSKYPNALRHHFDLVMPGFINTHTHLEFSASSYRLEYGDFLAWLASVMANRDELSDLARGKLIQENIKQMISFGTTTIGEISSFGSDLLACVSSPARIVFFTELLSRVPNPSIKASFKERFALAKSYKSELFTPALSAHSPYSTHPDYLSFVINLAKDEDLLISTHFLESDYENEYLRENKGLMKETFAKFSKADSFYTPNEFLSYFLDSKTLFTHCVYANENELDFLRENNFSLIHCPRSNALLSKKKLDLNLCLNKGLTPCLATDGLSSNFSLNMLDELRFALFMHADANLPLLAKKLILMATNYAGKALYSKIGQIKPGFCADLACFDLSTKPILSKQLALQFILNAKQASKVFINGDLIDFTHQD